MNTIEIRTRAREELVDLTAEVGRVVAASGVTSGVCVVTVPHTTAGVTVNENARVAPEITYCRRSDGAGASEASPSSPW